MAITNHLIVTFERDNIDKNYDFFALTTSDKYIPGGAYIIDKPVEQLKAESVVFDSGRTMFIMFKKHTISRLALIRVLEDEKIMLKQVNARDIKDYILFRLLLNSINNFECEGLTFNNITGKLFIVIPEWIKKNQAGFKALNINVDSEMNITAEAVGFTNYSLFKEKKKLSNYPKYTFADKNCALKRVLHQEETTESFVRKSLYGKKVEIPFFCLSPKELRQNKVFFIYKVLDIVSIRYKGLISIELDDLEIADKITDYRDERFMSRAFADFNSRQSNVISYVEEPEYRVEFFELVEKLKKKTQSSVTVSSAPKHGTNNIVFIHNEEYYLDHHYDDPYKKLNRDTAIQCVTVEDGVDKIIKDNNAVFNTIIKETVIKNDIFFSHHFTLDDWGAFGFSNDWFFGKEKDGKHYFIVVKPNGQFELKVKRNDFESFGDPVLDECSEYLTLNTGKEKVIVSDGIGNILVISRTNRMMLPSKDLFELQTISRSKATRETFLSGVVDINYFKAEDEVFFYNAGIKGAGMNTAIPKAAILYKIEIVKGMNIMPDILETMSVSFVKYNMFTVMPYPLKYLNEWCTIQTSTQ